MRIRTAALVGFLILGMAATPALAKKKKKKSATLGPVVTVSAPGNSTSTPGTVSAATATCPPGTVAMGGGFSTPFTASGAVVVDNSYRNSDTSWTASGTNFGGTAAVTAYVNCRRNRTPVVDAIGTGVVFSGVLMGGTASAVCPGGTQLIAGGFQTDRGATNTQIAYPQQNATTAAGIWTVRSTNNGTGNRTLTAHAYCTRLSKPPTIVSSMVAPTLTQLGTVTVNSPACPAPKKGKGKKGEKRKKPVRQQMAAGGFISPAASSSTPIAAYSESRVGGGGWLATAVNTGLNAGTLPVTSQGICV
jgi:hypothetical protein